MKGNIVSYDFKLIPLITIRMERAFTPKWMEHLILMIAEFQDVIVRWQIFFSRLVIIYTICS